MLNCCILRKKMREDQNNKSGSSSQTTSQASAEGYSGSASDTDFDDDDEFYECSDNINDKKESEKPLDGDHKSRESSPYIDSVSSLPEGRLRKCGNLKLRNSDTTPLYIPVTQEPAPMTEDLLEEHAKVLVQLGTDQEGAQLRAKMQSTCLTSDMEAFKAANPNSVLEDFVRWYSPRDWIEEEVVDEFTGTSSTKGHLSARMLIPGNMWSEVWSNSRPVPARKQKRLFDDTKEAEKVLHFLSSLRPAQVAFHLFPMLIHSSLLNITKHSDSNLKSFSSLLDAVVNKAIKVTRSSIQDVNMYEELINMVGTAETYIARIQSVKAKFSAEQQRDCEEHDDVKAEGLDEDDNNEEQRINSFIYDLLEGKEVNVTDTWQSPVGVAITKLFTDAYKAANLITENPSTHNDNERYAQMETAQQFPAPNQREYIIRMYAARPAIYSTVSPQRMHCILSNGSFRIAGAFSEDTLFQ